MHMQLQAARVLLYAALGLAKPLIYTTEAPLRILTSYGLLITALENVASKDR